MKIDWFGRKAGGSWTINLSAYLKDKFDRSHMDAIYEEIWGEDAESLALDKFIEKVKKDSGNNASNAYEIVAKYLKGQDMADEDDLKELHDKMEIEAEDEEEEEEEEEGDAGNPDGPRWAIDD